MDFKLLDYNMKYESYKMDNASKKTKSFEIPQDFINYVKTIRFKQDDPSYGDIAKVVRSIVPGSSRLEVRKREDLEYFGRQLLEKNKRNGFIVGDETSVISCLYERNFCEITLDTLCQTIEKAEFTKALETSLSVFDDWEFRENSNAFVRNIL